MPNPKKYVDKLTKYLEDWPQAKVTLQDYRKKKLDRFLEGSQVTEPLYHGTIHDFSEFKPSLRSDLGSHLGTVDQANDFAMYDRSRITARDSGKLMPVYASIKNPLRLEDKGMFDHQTVGAQLLDMGLITDEQFDNLHYLSDKDGLKFVQKAIEDAGHDGVVYLNRREGFNPFGPDGVEGEELNEMMDLDVEELFPDARDSYIIFRPGQVKSAIGNRGSFDPTNPDITKAKGGSVAGLEAVDRLAARPAAMDMAYAPGGWIKRGYKAYSKYGEG